MACNRLFLLGFIAFVFVISKSSVNCTQSVAVEPLLDFASMNRDSFPPGFIFGAGSSSYQFEGAAMEGGRGPSIWDTFTHEYPEKIQDGKNGDVAIDAYHRYKEDVGIMTDMNLDSYRFSISWSRILPNTKYDQKATERAIDFMYGWFMDPLTSGEYPKSMRSLVRTRLPKFTTEQARLLIGSFDFIGLNYYSTTYASDAPHLSKARPSYITDSLVNPASYLFSHIIMQIASDWLYVYPRGIRDLLLYTKEKYNNPLIYITENGINEFNDPTLSVEESLMDTFRIDYHYRHLFYLRFAIRQGVNVKGYYVWSLFDNFEWSSGYTKRFGMIFVDYKNGLKRYQKLSALWFKIFLKKEARLYGSSK
ncbi:Isoflavonoid 7-O-beta-apiosyl-glucoside beta-glycosidase [Spatholobus suberectus]|nr:Isoflavonoid 7-O-beta-apiosyl-glucoside beta-glycosidase [Spatholobus suberectus]